MFATAHTRGCNNRKLDTMNNSPAESTFAKALRSERKRMGLTQARLAEVLGTSQQNIAGMEKGLSLPRPDLHERMVDIFGNTSVIAALPPRRDLLLATEAISKASATASLATFQRQQENLNTTDDPVKPEMKVPRLRRDRNNDLKALLPPELHNNVERVLAVFDTFYRVDYLSDKLCVEIKSPANLPSVLSAARAAMQQLHIYASVLKQQYKDYPQPMPVLVHGCMNIWTSPDNNPRGKTVVVEGGLMGIRVVIVDTLAQAADFIVKAEKGVYQQSPEELGADEDY